MNRGILLRTLIAHRGNNNHKYRENTKEALLAALQTDYIAGVELDVRRTKDEQLVILHNPTISFSSNGHGIVKNMTLKELETYNFGTESYPSKISTLDAFLKEVKSSKMILIEAKEHDIETLLWKVIQKYPRLNIWICSFDYEFVKKFKKEHPTYKVGLIMGEYINHNKDTSMLDFISTKDPNRKTNQMLFLWGIKNKESIESIDSSIPIITDYSDLLKDVR